MEPGFGDMQITRRGLEVTMTEQQLDAAQVGAGIEQVGGKGVAQDLRTKRLADAQLPAQMGTESGSARSKGAFPLLESC